MTLWAVILKTVLQGLKFGAQHPKKIGTSVKSMQDYIQPQSFTAHVPTHNKTLASGLSSSKLLWGSFGRFCPRIPKYSWRPLFTWKAPWVFIWSCWVRLWRIWRALPTHSLNRLIVRRVIYIQLYMSDTAVYLFLKLSSCPTRSYYPLSFQK